MPNLIAAAFLLHRFPALSMHRRNAHLRTGVVGIDASPEEIELPASSWSSGGGHVGLLESQAVGTAAVS